MSSAAGRLIHLGKGALRAAARRVGFDLVRYPLREHASMLGLAALPIRTIVDVGANTGQWAAQALDVFPRATIYSFEPLPSAYDELSRWADTTHGRVRPLNLALGVEETTIAMYAHLDHSPASSILKTTTVGTDLFPELARQTKIDVRQLPMDRAITSHDVHVEPDLLVKLDVQGYQDRVIRGGHDTLRRARALIVEVGIKQIYEGQGSFRAMVDELDDLGLRYAGNVSQSSGPDGSVIELDSVFVR